MAKVEFYVADAEKHLAVLDDDAVPRAGEYINIRKKTYIVRRVTWAIDQADQLGTTRLRANVVLDEL
jgi:hypothetical protein